MKYHTLKLKYKDKEIPYRVSDEVMKWLFIPDYNTYLNRCDILIVHVISKIKKKLIEIEKEKNNASNDNS